ncbi:MAG: MarC family protein [Bacteroidales bacterium]|nr:MarC family protein [Bacteroidales bacterium]MCF8396942.1 MarC family protein [Bacteroidales bacterium]
MNASLLLSSFVAFFALVNPIQKILLVSTLKQNFNRKELNYISLKSSLTALVILIFFLFLGELIFHYVFHIQLYAFKITCGIVLMINGLLGLQKGNFLQIDGKMRIDDLTAVPIALPMIAGPATITAAVTFTANYGRVNTILSIFLALLINYLLMLAAPRIGSVLIRHNFMNALIRITGLIVATIGLQMIFDGLGSYIQYLGTI